jgi:hypothetical protein
MLGATATAVVAPLSAPTSSGDVIGIAGVLAVIGLVAWRAAHLFDSLFGPQRLVLSIAAAGFLPWMLITAVLLFILSKTPAGVSAESAASLLSAMPAQGRFLLIATLVTGVGAAGMTVQRRRSRDAKRAKADIGQFE